MRGLVLLGLLATSCVRTSAVTCADGTVCREGTACHGTSGGFVCVTPDQLAACDGLADGAACSDATGTCVEGFCLPIQCGNGRMEPGEACDDGNSKAGDGCSTDCLSDETCGNGTIDPVVDIGGMLAPNEQCDDGGLLSHDGCSSGCLVEMPRWIPRDAIPSRRFDAGVATEDKFRRIVLFGGRDGERSNTRTNDTWEWSDGGWSQLVIPLSPVPRSGHAMAFDGEQTVMFGGTTGTSTLGDTWILTGSTWSPHAGPNPPARTNHAMAYMPGVGIVMFGGNTDRSESDPTSAKTYDDTWVFDGTGWTELSARGPSARQRHVMVYDPVRHHVVLSGGVAGGVGQGTTWTFDGIEWTQATAATTPVVWDASASFDRAQGRIVMHGGAISGTLLDGSGVLPSDAQSQNTYEWDGTTWQLRDQSDTPGPSFGAAGATDPITGRALQFGGAKTENVCPLGECIGLNNRTWSWNAEDWVDTGFIANPLMKGNAATVDVDRRRVVVFGGVGGLVGNSIHELGDGSWQRVNPLGLTPQARSHAAIAFARIGDVRTSLLFGGRNNSGVDLDTMYAYDGTRWTPVPTSALPPARSRHSMVFDAKRERLVMFGGVTGTTPRDDLWEWDGTTWVEPPILSSAPRPTARMDAAMAYDPINENVVLFGGDVSGSVSGQTWTWNGVEWTEHALALSPPPRRASAMAWDAARQRIVLFGSGETLGNDTWEWDGSTWTFVAIVVPPAPRSQHLLVSAPTGDGVLALGGITEIDGPATNDVLHLRYLSSTPSEVCRADVDDDGDGAAGCADPDCWTSCTPYCPHGDPSCTTGPRCGDGTCDPQRETCGMCGDCSCFAQCGNLVCDPGESAASCPGDC